MPTKRWESFAMTKSYFWLLYVYPCFWRFLPSLVMPLLELSCVYLIKLYLQCARHSEGNDLNSQHTFSSLICNSQLTDICAWCEKNISTIGPHKTFVPVYSCCSQVSLRFCTLLTVILYSENRVQLSWPIRLDRRWKLNSWTTVEHM